MYDPEAFKFGGTSNAVDTAVARCAQIAGRAIGTSVSAPGELSPTQLDGFPEVPGVPHEFLGSKVTKQLLKAHEVYLQNGEIDQYILVSVTARYAQIVNGLAVTALGPEWLRDIAPRIKTSVQSGEDYASMLGERLQAEIYEGMGWRLMDPGRAGHAVLPLHLEQWVAWLDPFATGKEKLIFPGNTYFDGQRLRTFGPGGSDTSSTHTAVGMHAEVYKNMTDTSAQSANPDLITDPRRRRHIDHLTYEEGRELGRNGTGLLHPEAIVPLMGSGIPTEIRDTFDIAGQFTRYTDELDDPRRAGRVMAISLVREASIVSVHEPGMSEAIGRIADLSHVIAQNGVSVLDVEGEGSDREGFIVAGKDRKQVEATLRQAVNGRGTVEATDCAVITLVGYNLRKQALAIRNKLEQQAGVSADTTWMQGRHSLRFTVAPDEATRIVDESHACLVEQPVPLGSSKYLHN